MNNQGIKENQETVALYRPRTREFYIWQKCMNIYLLPLRAAWENELDF